MPYLDHVRICNAYDPAGVLPFVVDGERVGWIAPDVQDEMRARRDVFAVERDRVALVPALRAPAEREAAVNGALRHLAGTKGVGPWRGEPFAVAPRIDRPPLFRVERCLIPVLGVRGYGIHLNGWVPAPDGDPAGIRMWIAKRALADRTFPGKLDHMVAGGHAAGYAVAETMIKEAEEEAGVPHALALTARPTGIVSYRVAMSGGIREDVLFAYDLALPPGFVPVNRDGEVMEFALWPVRQVMQRVRDTLDFKFNVPLVLMDFFIRHGLLGPDDADYEALCLGLRLRD